MVAQIGIVQGRFTAATGAAWLDDAVERVRGMPGVEGVSYAFGAPLTLRSGMTTGARLVANGREPGFQAMYQDSFVGPDYFKVMGIGIVKGREFRAGRPPRRSGGRGRERGVRAALSRRTWSRSARSCACRGRPRQATSPRS